MYHRENESEYYLTLMCDLVSNDSNGNQTHIRKAVFRLRKIDRQLINLNNFQ
jgi:hypothetical protein